MHYLFLRLLKERILFYVLLLYGVNLKGYEFDNLIKEFSKSATPYGNCFTFVITVCFLSTLQKYDFSL